MASEIRIHTVFHSDRKYLLTIGMLHVNMIREECCKKKMFSMTRVKLLTANKMANKTLVKSLEYLLGLSISSMFVGPVI